MSRVYMRFRGLGVRVLLTVAQMGFGGCAPYMTIKGFKPRSEVRLGI